MSQSVSVFTVSRTFDVPRDRQWRTDVHINISSPTASPKKYRPLELEEPAKDAPKAAAARARKVPPMSPAMRTIHLRPHNQPTFLVSANDLRCGVIALIGEAARHYDHAEGTKSAVGRARQLVALRAAFTETEDLLDALKSAPEYDHCEEDRVTWAGDNFTIYREALQRVAERKFFFPKVDNQLEEEDSIEFW